MSASKHLQLHFGALSPPITEQVAAQGLRLTETDAAKFQRAGEAITYLHVHGFFEDEEDEDAEEENVDRLRRKLIERVAATVTPITEPSLT